MDKEDILVYTVEEAGKMLGISRPTAYKCVKSGDIPSIRIGGRVLVPKQALANLLSNPPVMKIAVPAKRLPTKKTESRQATIEEARINFLKKVLSSPAPQQSKS